MRLRPALPYFTYAASFIVLAVGAAGLSDTLDFADWAGVTLAYAVAVPVALLIALWLGRVTYRGMLVTSTIAALVLFALAVMMLLSFGMTLSDAFSPLWSANLARDMALCIGAPLAWLRVFRWLSSNNAFNRTPLRGAG